MGVATLTPFSQREETFCWVRADGEVDGSVMSMSMTSMGTREEETESDAVPPTAYHLVWEAQRAAGIEAEE